MVYDECGVVVVEGGKFGEGVFYVGEMWCFDIFYVLIGVKLFYVI